MNSTLCRAEKEIGKNARGQAEQPAAPAAFKERRRHDERGQKHGPHAEERNVAQYHVLHEQRADEIQRIQNAAPGLQPELVQLHIGKLEIDLVSFHSMTSKSLMMKTCDSTERSTEGLTTA